jgi:hypothetical protein
MGVQFSIKSREAKNRYVDANIKNVISKLSIDIKNYGLEIVLRKLLLSLISVQLAQNIGVDHIMRQPRNSTTTSKRVKTLMRL